MDPVEIREDRVASNTAVAPAEGVIAGTPVAPAAPAVGAPLAAATPIATNATAAPVTPAAGTSAYSSRTGVYPVGYRTIQLIWLIAGVVDIILALDFIFRAAAANDTGFAHYIYRLGGSLAAPFDGIFNTTALNGGASLVRWSDVLAVAVYSMAAWIVTKLVRITATPRSGVSAV